MAITRPAVFDRLEANANVVIEKLTVAQVSTLVRNLSTVKSLADVALACNIEESEVLDLTADLGTWLCHSDKTPTKFSEVELVAAAKMSQMTMFQDPEAEIVVIPIGFERHGKNRRDVSSSLARIVYTKPDDVTLMRFLDRQYATTSGVLSAREIFVMWSFACLGRLDDLDGVSDSSAYSKVMISAFDLFDTVISDVERNLRSVCDPDVDIEDALRAISSLRWVNEARLGHLERAAQTALMSNRREVFSREQRRFADEVRTSVEWNITDISQLREGQVLRIVQAAGLGEVVTRRDTNELRARLTTLGLDRDLDRLLPIAARAQSVGIEDAFWEAIERRMSADPNWSDDLDTAFEIANRKQHQALTKTDAHAEPVLV